MFCPVSSMRSWLAVSPDRPIENADIGLTSHFKKDAGGGLRSHAGGAVASAVHGASEIEKESVQKAQAMTGQRRDLITKRFGLTGFLAQTMQALLQILGRFPADIPDDKP